MPVKRKILLTALLASLFVLPLSTLAGASSNPQKRSSPSSLPRFSSCPALANTLRQAVKKGGYGGFYVSDVSVLRQAPMAAPAAGAAVSESAAQPKFTPTNVQVEGVDEPDIVKTDGNYLYVLSKKNLVITRAYPLKLAKVLTTVTFRQAFQPQELFLHEDVLLVVGSRTYSDRPVIQEERTPSRKLSPLIYPPPALTNLTFVDLYDIRDRTSPRLLRRVEVDSRYVTARKIGEWTYLVLSDTPEFHILQSLTESKRNRLPEGAIPMVRDLRGQSLRRSASSSTFKPLARCTQINYVTPVEVPTYITILGVDMTKPETPIARRVVLGASENVYASLQNIYVANTTFFQPNVEQPLPADTGALHVIRPFTQRTIVHKFGINRDQITYDGNGSVPGRILNQFSMDEHNNHFRIATTDQKEVMRGERDAVVTDLLNVNNVYILNSEMKIVGRLEDLAPGENIFAARFMGERVYLVTFKKIDPLFVIDLKNPQEPKVLGKLKIPGYSDYLHPFDENHLIGLGKNTAEAKSGDFAWYQGLKLALFDVSDPENPKERALELIGDRGSDSYALRDHKAFLFDRDNNLLVMPVLLAVIKEEQKRPEEEPNLYGDFTFQGAYAWRISLEKGFAFLGRLTHYESDEVFKKSGYYFGDEGFNIKRALTIEDVLYTVSDEKVMGHKVPNLTTEAQFSLTQQ